MSHCEGRGRLLVVAGLLVYVALFVAGPVLHHDFDCHLKTPGHCPACIANPVGCGAESFPLGTTTLGHAELVERSGATALEPPSLTLRIGRSPPA